MWIFKVGEKNAAGIAFSTDLLWPLGAFIRGLAFDILQYLYKSTAWWLYFEYKHRAGINDDAEIDPPSALNFLTNLFFYLKVIACGTGFYWLLEYIWAALHLH